LFNLRFNDRGPEAKKPDTYMDMGIAYRYDTATRVLSEKL